MALGTPLCDITQRSDAAVQRRPVGPTAIWITYEQFIRRDKRWALSAGGVSWIGLDGDLSAAHACAGTRVGQRTVAGLFYSAVNLVLGVPFLFLLVVGYDPLAHPVRYSVAAILLLCITPIVWPLILVTIFKSTRLVTRIRPRTPPPGTSSSIRLGRASSLCT